MGGKAKTGPAVARRAKLLQLIKNTGLHNLDMTETAKTLGCARSTIYTDLEALSAELPKATAQGIAVVLTTDMRRARDEIQKLLKQKDPHVRAKAVHLLLKLGEREQAILQATGHFKARDRGSAEDPIHHEVEGAGLSVTLWRPGDAPMTPEMARQLKAQGAPEEEEP